MEKDFVIQVDPEKLKEQAAVISGYVNDIKKDFDGIRRLVKQSGIYWQGEASRRHRQIFDNYEEDISQILKRLGEHPIDLQKMAGEYVQVEKLNETLAGRLPDNVL